MTHEVERARAADREALLELLYRVFRSKNAAHPRFEALYPEMFEATDEAMGRHFVIRENGTPVSCVGLYPVDFQIGPARVSTCGLGQVATEPSFQGRGMMHALMTRVGEELRARRPALAWLGGRHDRYSKYGWEWAGLTWRVVLDAKSLGPAPGGWTVREWSETDDDYDRLWAEREQQPVRGLCPASEWRIRMRRGGSQSWLARQGGRMAFAVYNPGWKSVQEWGGDPGGLRALLAKLAESGPVSVSLLPEVDAGFPFFQKHGASAGGGLGMLSVVDLETLVRDYAPLIRERLPADRSLRLVVREQGRVVTAAEIRGDDAQGAPSLGVELDRCRMTGFVFGPVRASRVAGLDGDDRWVDRVFPLPFASTPLFGV